MGAKATTIQEAFRLTDPDKPLSGPGLRNYYVDLSQARGGYSIGTLLESRLTLGAGEPVHLLISGHRGDGKSTALLKLIEDWKDRYLAIYLDALGGLVNPNDFTYTDWMLVIAQEVAQALYSKAPLEEEPLRSVMNWFAEVTDTKVDYRGGERAAEIELKSGIKVGAELPGLFGAFTSVLSTLRSSMKAGTETTRTVREQFQPHLTHLKDRVNDLLDNARQRAREVLGKDLLLVLDNLEKVPNTDLVRRLFWDHGNLLRDLRCHAVYTFPLNLAYSDRLSSLVFEEPKLFPAVRVGDAPSGEGWNTLRQIVERRIDIDAVFTDSQMVVNFIEMSGGVVRDLVRLIHQSCLFVQEAKGSRIDKATAERAIERLSFYYEKMVSAHHYPKLAQIHRDPYLAKDPDYQDLLAIGALVQYGGDRLRYAAHPAVQRLEQFRRCL